MIATDAFFDLAREAAASQGLPDARILSVAHPIGGVADSALRARADVAVDALLALLANSA